MNFVFSAPVCLFPSRRPQDSLLKPFCAASVRSPGQNRVETAHLDEVGSGADSYDNNTTPRILPSSGQEIASRKRYNQIPERRAFPPGDHNLMRIKEILRLADPRSMLRETRSG